MVLLLDETSYAIATPGRDDVGEPVPYGEIATLSMPEGDQHFISLVNDPDDESSFKVYESTSFPNFKSVPFTSEEASFDDGDGDGDDEGDDEGDGDID